MRETLVPVVLPGAAERGPLVEASRDAVLLRVPGVGRFLIEAKDPVLVERATGATAADLCCFRNGPIAAAAALLRGKVAFRAAAVAIGGRAVVLCGASAVGKSALAAALAQRGHPVLADAVAVISGLDQEGVPTVEPLAPDVVLWPDSVQELGLRSECGRRVRPGLAKRAYSIGPDPVASPLAAVAILRADENRTEPAFDPLEGASKLRALMAVCWHLRLVEPLGRSAAQFRSLAHLTRAIPCMRVVRPRRGASPMLLAELVEKLAA